MKNSNQYNHPDEDVLGDVDFSKFGSVIIGDRGKLFFHRGKNNWLLKTNSSIDEFQWPQIELPRANRQDPFQEWMDSISGKIGQPESHFGHAGPMTEMILLGVIAQRNPNERLVWNSETMNIEGRSDLNHLVRRAYRNGWKSPV